VGLGGGPWSRGRQAVAEGGPSRPCCRGLLVKLGHGREICEDDAWLAVPKVSRWGRSEMHEAAGYFVTARAATRRLAGEKNMIHHLSACSVCVAFSGNNRFNEARTCIYFDPDIVSCTPKYSIRLLLLLVPPDVCFFSLFWLALLIILSLQIMNLYY
jgi:hypothetical protein